MKTWLSILGLIISLHLNAQMVVGIDTLYGNEWIVPTQSYYKVKVADDGMYRIDFNTLNNAGVLNNNPQGTDFQLYRLGNVVPIYVSNSGTLGNSDYITFYGEKNRGELDKHLYKDANYQLNPLYSMYSDTSIYYLTWNNTNSGSNQYINTPNDLTNLPNKEDYCWVESVLEYHNKHQIGKAYGGSSDVSAKYDIGEGFSKNTYSTNQTFSLPTPNIYTNGGNTTIEARIYAKAGTHYTSINVEGINYLLDTFNNYAVKPYELSVPSTGLANITTINITGNASTDDKFYVSNVKANYPMSFDFNNQDVVKFVLTTNNQRQYIEINNFNHGGQTPILYDITNQLYITTQLVGNTIQVALPSSTVDRTLILVNPNTYTNPISVEEIILQDFTQQQGNYVILSHSRLFDDGNGVDYVQNYANYRSTVQGGSYNAVVVDILQVYEQFGYGVQNHEQAIRNFVQWSIENWNAEMLFVIGKGVYYRKTRQDPVGNTTFNLIPSFGYPSSDNLLAGRFDANQPSISVGRIAAFTPNMVRQYLKKVQDMEYIQQNAAQTIEDKAWMKNVLHLGGGDLNIQEDIKSRLQEMGDSLQASKFGANILALYKNSTNAVQQVGVEDVTNFINEGLSWITFFGHSAPNTLDFDIGDPNQYNNAGRYPMIYAMGCNTNRLFETSSTLSEDYVFVEDKGAIGFIGSTATTSLPNLNKYGRILYDKMGGEMYGATIGELLKTVTEDNTLTGYWGELVQHNILLHGDPALKIYPHQAPDYVVNKAKSKINPTLVNVQQDSFELELVIANLGFAVEDSLQIYIEQEYPSGERVEVLESKVASPKSQSTYNFTIPLDNKNIIGNNKFWITLDNNDEIVELPIAAEANNQSVIEFTIVSNNAFPVSPYEFAIVNQPTVTLKASTANLFSNSVSYIIELDTTVFFDSPQKINTIIESNGGLIQWQPNITMVDSTVYYWRISIDSSITNGLGYDWQYSSFVYIDQSLEGWNQSHFYQKSTLSEASVKIDSFTRSIDFADIISEFKVQTGAFYNLLWEEVAVFKDGFKYVNYWLCPANLYPDHSTLWILGFDKNLLEYRNINDSGGQYNCWGNPNAVYIKGMNDLAERQEAIDFIENYIPSQDYVIIFTTQGVNTTYHADQWAADSITTLAPNFFQVLETQGATKIRDLATNQTPYIFIFQKDNPTWSGKREVHAASINDIIEARTDFIGKRAEGSITSIPVGPATSYGDLYWNVTDYNPTEDTISIDVIGITQTGQDSILMTGITARTLSLDFVNPWVFPSIKLRYNVKDEISRTPAQLDYWRVTYTPVPEAALSPNQYVTFYQDTIQQGDEMKFELAVENISQQNMDSLLVKYTLTDAANTQIETYKRHRPLAKGDTLRTSFSMNTSTLSGKNILGIEVNPEDDQREKFHFNNIGAKEFFVQSDNTNPIMDVTFDGMHIMNGDIISAKPTIVMLLEDENEFFALTDTSLFRIFVQHPTGEVRRYYIDGQTMLFYPADEDNIEDKNKAKIEFMPEFLEDGTYQLRVEGKDATGNSAGKVAYKISFEVITRHAITNVLNYPNPFSTSTQFVFTLTGSEVPDQMQIQIFTVSGQLIREISMAELGLMRIGNNRTDFVWDGTDQMGDKLANGVYLYRVTAMLNGEPLESLNNGTNDYFKNGFGKMVILR